MKRAEFEKVVGPVLNDIRKGLAGIRGRMPPHFKVNNLELIGGASRIPFIKKLIKDVFNTEASRTLNSNESTARGAAIYGVAASKLMNMDYHLPNYNLIDICACWNKTRNNEFYG